MKFDRPTYAEINLAALEQNVQEIRKIIPGTTKIMGVVKANAYGHGAVKVSAALVKGGIDYLAVAAIGEAVEIRDAGITAPILILSEPPVEAVENILKYNLTQTIYTPEVVRALDQAAQVFKTRAKVHLKIDTGMGRVGVPYLKTEGLLKELLKLENLIYEGVFTHFARAEDLNDNYTRDQLAIFTRSVAEIKNRGIEFSLRHSANSAAALFWPQTHLDMVRVGLCLYGIYPREIAKTKINLKPALEFKTKLIYLKEVPKGSCLGYAGTYTTLADTRIATLPVGYADGLNRSLSNQGSVLIRGKKFPIVGKISMDLTLVDVGAESVAVGDEVVLIGKQGKELISLEETARLQNTVVYEVICGIGKRVPRIYL